MDTLLSGLLCLKRFRADVAVGAVSAGPIVVCLNVFKHGVAHLLARGEALTVNRFHLQRVEKTLGTCIMNNRRVE